MLDDIKSIKDIDKNGMLDLVEGLPEMAEKAAAIPAETGISKTSGIGSIVIAGMGGSAIGGDVFCKVLSDRSGIPAVVCRDYEIPEFVCERTLFFALSYSGNTEETLSAFEKAAKKGARIVAVTSGGRLAKEASEKGFPVISIPEGLPPRAALPYLLVPMIRVMEKTGLIAGLNEQLDEALKSLREIREQNNAAVPEDKNEAKKIARALQGKIPFILGNNTCGDTAAYRWKTQFSENTKITSINNSFPELDHNEIVNLAFLQQGKHDFSLVFLRDKSESEKIRKRIEITKKVISHGKPDMREVWALGTGKLSKILSLMYMGDFVSVYLAVLNGIDPTPVVAIDILKKELAK